MSTEGTPTPALGPLAPVAPHEGDAVSIATVYTPHITIDCLTPRQIALLLAGQQRLRALAGDPALDADAPAAMQRGLALISKINEMREHGRLAELALAGHVALDLTSDWDGQSDDPELRLCRWFATGGPTDWTRPGLVDADGAPVAQNGRGGLTLHRSVDG